MRSMQAKTSGQAAPTRYVISVLVSDRVGILRDITSAATDRGANIDGISQTVVEGFFTVILTASFDRPCSADAVRDAILGNFPPGEASLVVRPAPPVGAARPAAAGERYIVTMNGADRKGILKTVTAFFASKGINVEDWYVEFSGAHVTHIGEVTVPRRLDIQQIQEEFRTVASSLGLVSLLQHNNIFRAINEIGPIQSLLAGVPETGPGAPAG